MLSRMNYKKVFIKWFMSLACFVAITIVIISGALYQWYSVDNVKAYGKMSVNILRQTSGSMEMLDTNIKNLGFQLLQDLDISMMMFSDSTNYRFLNSVNGKLIHLLSANPIIDSAYLVNKRADFITGTPSTHSIVARDYHGHIQQLMGSHKDNAIVRIDTYESSIKQPDGSIQNVLSYVFFQTRESDEDDSFLIINIKVSDITNTIVNMNPIQGNKILVTDLKGKVVFSQQPSELTGELPQEPYLEHIAESREAAGYLTEVAGDGKDKYLLAYVYSENLEYRFISITPYNIVLSSSMILKHRTVLLSLIIFLFGMGASVIITRYFYAPLKKLIKKYIYGLTEMETRDIREFRDEFDLLDSFIEKNTTRALSLDDFVNTNLPVIKQDFIKRILDGKMEVNNDRIKQQLAELGICFNHPAYRVIYIMLEDGNPAQQNAEGIEALKADMCKRLEDLLKPVGSSEIFARASDRTAILLLNYEEQQPEVEEQITAACLSLQEYSVKIHGLSLSIAMGKKCLFEVHPSYVNACELSNYRIKYGKGALLYDEKVKEGIAGDDLFPENEKNALLRSIRSLSAEGMKESIRQMMEQFYKYSCDDIYRAVLHVLYSSLQSVKDMIKSEHILVDFNLFSIYEELKACESLVEMEKQLITLYDKIIGDLDKNIHHKGEEQHQRLIKKVTDFIDKNFSDSRISLEYVAEQVNMNSSYLGKIFKENTGMHFTEYMNYFRLDEAKKLLVETNLNLNDISARAGFNSSSYFVTCFKKYIGITPVQFRNISQ